MIKFLEGFCCAGGVALMGAGVCMYFYGKNFRW